MHLQALSAKPKQCRVITQPTVSLTNWNTTWGVPPTVNLNSVHLHYLLQTLTLKHHDTLLPAFFNYLYEKQTNTATACSRVPTAGLRRAAREDQRSQELYVQ